MTDERHASQDVATAFTAFFPKPVNLDALAGSLRTARRP
jgi:hypothetical protein